MSKNLLESLTGMQWRAGVTPSEQKYPVGTERELAGIPCIRTESGWVPKEYIGEVTDPRSAKRDRMEWESHLAGLMSDAEIVHDMVLHMGEEDWHHKLDHAHKDMDKLEEHLHSMLRTIAKAKGKV